MTQLEKFFVVTRTSIYECAILDGAPEAFKLACRPGNMSKVSAGDFLGFNESPRRLLVISSNEGLRVRNGSTSPIVALFLNDDDAWRCFRSDSSGKWSHAWWSFTQATLDAIGSDHPHFRIDQKHPPRCGRNPAIEA